MPEIKITADQLEQLSKLADWQLLQMGFCPTSITTAWLKLNDK